MTDPAAPTTPDWTADASGRSNSSPLFEAMIEEVARLIRQEAHFLLQGDTESVARLIMAQLAHKHGLGPARSTQAEALAHKIADRMAQAYNLSMARAADVAKACDESIDPTGNLLGWLREYARLRSPDALFRLLQEPGDVADLPTATDALDGPYNTAGSQWSRPMTDPAAPTTQEWPNPDACCSRNAFEDDAHSRTCEHYLTSLEPGQVRVQGFDRFWSRLKERFDGR